MHASLHIIFESGTDSISPFVLFFLFFFLIGVTVFKAMLFQIGSG